ncbi:hypothetical protein L218DRAFT_677274 [Marasmius fiardii PR-910]|nr:hypothetical protein L218DRAFT_677274 [Marasmius fiardii PR-910]
MSPPVLSYFQRLAMSYRYGGGEYRNESTSASSSTSQFPQWETLEQQQQQIAEPQQQSEAVLTPTQPLHHSFFPIADEHLPPGQLLPHLPSPTDPPHLPLISHQGSYDSTSDGRFNSLSPADVGTPSSTPTDPTPKPSRSGRGRHPLQRAHARTIANPYPPSSMHAMQPPPVPPGREHRVGDPNMFMHHSPQATSTASPITNTSNTVGSPSVAQSGGLPEVNRCVATCFFSLL